MAEHPSLVTSLPRDAHRAVADAAWNGDAAAVTTMLAIGLDPAARGQDGGTALHCAAWQGAAATVEVILQHPGTAALLTTDDTHHHQPPLGLVLPRLTERPAHR